jgi:hypothetical protein
MEFENWSDRAVWAQGILNTAQILNSEICWKDYGNCTVHCTLAQNVRLWGRTEGLRTEEQKSLQ